MKNLVGKLTGCGKEKYPQNEVARQFDFSVEVPESDAKDEEYDVYYSIMRVKYEDGKSEERRIFQIDPIGAFKLGVWALEYMGFFLQPSADDKSAEIIGHSNWSGHLSGSGFLRELNETSNTKVEFSIELSTKLLESEKSSHKFCSIFKLRSLDGRINEDFPIFALCPINSFLLAVSLLDARVSYFDSDFEY